MGTDYRILIEHLVAGRIADEELFGVLDDLLRWLGDVEGGASRAIRDALQGSGIASTEFREILLSRIDEALFQDETNPFRVLGLHSDASLSEQKIRYHRLLKVFHPDRALRNEQWMTRRAESINSAFDKVRKAEYAKPIPFAPAEAGEASGVALSPETEKGYNPHFRSPLRGRIGLSGNQFRNRVIIGLVLMSALFIGSLLIDYKFGHPQAPVRVAGLADSGDASLPATLSSGEVLADRKVSQPVSNKPGEFSEEQQRSAAGMSQQPVTTDEDRIAEKMPLEPEAIIPAFDALGSESSKRLVATSPDKMPAADNTSKPESMDALGLQAPPKLIPQRVAMAGDEVSQEKSEPRQKLKKDDEATPEGRLLAAEEVKEEPPVARHKPPKLKSKPDEAAKMATVSTGEKSRKMVTPTKPQPTASKQGGKDRDGTQGAAVPKQASKTKAPSIQRKQVEKPDKPTPVTIEVVQTREQTYGHEIKRGDDYWFSIWLMKAYVQAVEAGDLDFLQRAFSTSVNVNGQLRSRDLVLARYLQLFSETHKRRLDIDVKSVSYPDGDQGKIRISGVETLYQYGRSGAPRVTSKAVVFNVVKIGRGGEIAGISRN